MKEQREVLKQKIVDLVKNFMETEGGITKNDLQMLFGNPTGSIGQNECYAAFRLNLLGENGAGPKKSD